MKRATRNLALTVASVLMTMSWLATAQDGGPGVVSVRLVDVVPGKAAQFEAALKKYGEAVKQVTPDRGFNVRNLGIGGPGNAYVIFTTMDKPSDQQPRNVLAEAFGEEEAAATGAAFDEAIANTRVENFIPRADLSRTTELEPFEIVLVIRVEVALGRTQAYEEFMHKLVEATDKVAPDQHWFGYAPGLGAGTTYRFAIPMNWADLDNPGMSIAERLGKHFGEKKAASMLEENAANIVEVVDSVSINRPDLSVTPAD